MDRSGMDAERGRVVLHREKRVRKLAVVVALQNVLVAACLLVTLYVYYVCRDLQAQDLEHVHIRLFGISDIEGNTTLKFSVIENSNVLTLTGKEMDKISINCSGPYILHMDVFYMSLDGQEASGTLELQVNGTPRSSFNMSSTSLDVSRRWLHSIVLLEHHTEASLHLYSKNQFKIKQITVDLTSLLGRRCMY